MLFDLVVCLMSLWMLSHTRTHTRTHRHTLTYTHPTSGRRVSTHVQGFVISFMKNKKMMFCTMFKNA